jgi:hypothetical protein
MVHSPGGEQAWLLDELSLHHVPVKRRSFPKESATTLRATLDATLSLALSLHKTSPLAFAAWTLFVLFPRLLLRPLPNGCQGSFAAAALERRCRLWEEGSLSTLISEAHEAQSERAANASKALSEPLTLPPLSARAASLARVGEVGKACKVAFSYGLEQDPEVAAKFLSKLTLKQRHTHIPVYIPKIKPSANRIPQKAVSEAFSGMPKKSAGHRDGWTWELLRDAAQQDSTSSLLRSFAEHFSNGDLPKHLWAYLASVLMYPFHKKMPEERIPLADPALRPVTVGSVLTRFGCRVLVRMNRLMVAEQLLLSHQFSYGVKGGVQQVILACTLALQLNPGHLLLDLDSCNAHTFCSRDKLEEELELNILYHYMLMTYRALYGKTVTV